MTRIKEECGVVGVAHAEKDVLDIIWRGLVSVQHRGQEGNGIFTLESGEFHRSKRSGLVKELSRYGPVPGNLGIGHVRYTTTGSSPMDKSRGLTAQRTAELLVQPFFVGSPRSGVALCHNGNLVNYVALRRGISKGGDRPESDSDAAILLHYLSRELASSDDIETAVERVMSTVEGGYSASVLTGDGEMIAFRDPHGFRPLCYGEGPSVGVFASESVALDSAGVELTGDIEPGEMAVVSENQKVERRSVVSCQRHAHCIFEFVYFSRPDSILEGKEVYGTRVALGERLAKTYETDADVIVPVPDTARPAAKGIGAAAGIEDAEGLMKNRYVGRTFIMPGQTRRENSVAMKMNAVRSVLKDKRVILVDDSIVRGTTSRKTVELVRKGGADNIELWITCPPIVSPCFYGIDISTHEELIAATHTHTEIEKTLGVDRLCYQTRKGLVDAIGLDKNELCMACLTGEYPTRGAQQMADNLKESSGDTEATRYWERELVA